MADMWLQSRLSRLALLPPIHISFYQITSKGHQIVVKSEEECRQHRIAFNSLYLFSLGLLSMKRMEGYCIITRVERPVSHLSLRRPLGSALLPPDALKHPGGVASMTLDRGYPDWLVLSARLLAQPRLKIVQNIYVLVVFGLWLCVDITACCYV